MQNQGTPVWAQFIPLILVVIIVTVRMVRPQKISVTRMWIQPLVLCGVAGLVVYSSAALNPAPLWEIAVGMIAGAVAGIPFGALRGMHTDVKPAERPGVMYLGASWMTMLVFLAAFGLRSVVRAFVPLHGSLASVIGDGLLGFAIGYVATSYVLIYRKYEACVAAAAAAAGSGGSVTPV